MLSGSTESEHRQMRTRVERVDQPRVAVARPWQTVWGSGSRWRHRPSSHDMVSALAGPRTKSWFSNYGDGQGATGHSSTSQGGGCTCRFQSFGVLDAGAHTEANFTLASEPWTVRIGSVSPEPIRRVGLQGAGYLPGGWRIPLLRGGFDRRGSVAAEVGQACPMNSIGTAAAEACLREVQT